MYKHLANLWKSPSKNLKVIQRNRMNSWEDKALVKLEGPTRLDRAHALGYKSKQGFVVIRSRVPKGDRKRPKPAGGRTASKAGRFFSPSKSKQSIAEERAAKKFRNLEVLNSYWIAEDGNYAWYEIIFVDKHHPSIKADKTLRWILKPKHTGRVFRGKTSAGKRGRGLRNRGKGAEKLRPSLRAHKRLGK